MPARSNTAPASAPFSRGLTTLEQEVMLASLLVQGALPGWLQGALVRNGPAKFSDPARHAQYLELYADEAVLHGYVGVEPGIASIKQSYHGFWAAFPDAQLIIDDMMADGDKVACRFVVKGTHLGNFNGIPATGKPFNLPGITILRFVNGRCVERWSQADFMGLLQQLGVFPAA